MSKQILITKKNKQGLDEIKKLYFKNLIQSKYFELNISLMNNIKEMLRKKEEIFQNCYFKRDGNYGKFFQ